MVVSVEASMDHKTTTYWTAPERFERQSKPGYLKSMKQPLADRLLEALKPVRGPVRVIDIASKAQSPDDFPQLGGVGPASIAPGDFC